MTDLFWLTVGIIFYHDIDIIMMASNISSLFNFLIHANFDIVTTLAFLFGRHFLRIF